MSISSFPTHTKFIYPWRKYQQRVLDELEAHLSDDHLHVIAPPGSGKTVLGLEVAIRLNKPTLILAPTLAIRNQWIQRFCELFLQTNQVPEWISRDIRNPAFMTVVTYQGLHAACNNVKTDEEENEDEEDIDVTLNAKTRLQNLEKIVNGLKDQNVKTIIVDEAHHLKNEWWHTLTKVKEHLDPTIVGLTATPPYDVTPYEWRRYMDLNGPVDTEISVPELVIAGDLCTHQDLVYFSLPSASESHSITEFREKMDELYHKITTDLTLVKAIENHPFWTHPEENIEWIHKHISFYTASLIFMKANERYIPEIHIEVLGGKNLVIPKLDYQWLEILLAFYLYEGKKYFAEFETHQEHIDYRLKRYGAIEHGQIKFSGNKKLTGLLTSSISKLESIKKVVDFEYHQSGNNLRMVILSDFIRKEFFIQAPTNHLELNKMGVIPIFEKLRRENHANIKIGVLTGSVIIIPKTAFPIIRERARKLSITNITSSPVPFDQNYTVIHMDDKLQDDIIHLVTEIFQEGEIEVLIGTKSLLGEGWDAPAINALVLASFVGSFVVSNQMRGRAIRMQQGNADKTANIWHLACVDPGATKGGEDITLLKRRFKCFVGVSCKSDAAIENGTDRLDIPENIHLAAVVERKNNETLRMASDRPALKHRWHTALEKGVKLIEEIKIPFPKEREYSKVKKYYRSKTVSYTAALITTGLFVFGFMFLRTLGNMSEYIRNGDDLLILFTILGIIGIVIFGIMVLKMSKQYGNYRDLPKDLHQVGEALLHSLAKAGYIQTNLEEITIQSSVDDDGDIYCHLEGGSTFEKSIFTNALEEIIHPVNDPRYVIVRKSRYLKINGQLEYHAVPELLGRRKILAEYFSEEWNKRVGSCELINARKESGQDLLLATRVKSLAMEFQNEIEHVSKWR